jgi:hypothetical protein
MPYTIAYYNTSVQTSIEKWPTGISAGYVRIVEQMVVSGPNLGLPYTRPFGDGLFEIRAKGEEGIGRAAPWWGDVSSSCTASSRRRSRPRKRN